MKDLSIQTKSLKLIKKASAWHQGRKRPEISSTLPPDAWERIQYWADPKSFAMLRLLNRETRALPSPQELVYRIEEFGEKDSVELASLPKDKQVLQCRYAEALKRHAALPRYIRAHKGFLEGFDTRSPWGEFSANRRFLLTAPTHNEIRLHDFWHDPPRVVPLRFNVPLVKAEFAYGSYCIAVHLETNEVQFWDVRHRPREVTPQAPFPDMGPIRSAEHFGQHYSALSYDFRPKIVWDLKLSRPISIAREGWPNFYDIDPQYAVGQDVVVRTHELYEEHLAVLDTAGDWQLKAVLGPFVGRLGNPPGETLHRCLMSDDRRFVLITTMAGKREVWDLQRQPVMPTLICGNRINHTAMVVFAKSRNFVVSYERNKLFSLWDLEDLASFPLSVDLPFDDGHVDFAFLKRGKYLIASKKHEAIYLWQVGREPFLRCDLKLRVERQDLLGFSLTPDARNLLVLTEHKGFLAYDLDYDLFRQRPARPLLRGRDDKIFLRSMIAANLKSWRLRLVDRRDSINHSCPVGHENSVPLCFFATSGEDRFVLGCGRRSRRDEKCSLRIFDRAR